jgi:RNA polymerase sigma-70 factor (ECF subfamily)
MPKEGAGGSSAWVNPGVRAEDRDKARALFDAIAALPDRQRISFTLVQVQGMSYDEVCLVMGLGRKAVESLISRAKVNLRKTLANHRP